MTNHLGNKLNRLIKQRAYSAGQLQSIQREIDTLQEQLSIKEAEFNELSRRIAKFDKEISETSSIDPTDIRAIRAMPRVIESEQGYGSFRRELVRLLQISDRPMSTGELVEYMSREFSLPMETPAQRARVRDLVRRPLNVFKKYGAVIRHPSKNAAAQGVWEWVSTEDDC